MSAQQPSDVSRRTFLTRLALTGGAAAAAPLVTTSPILAANERNTLKPTFVGGTLQHVTSEALILHVPGYTPDLVEVRLEKATQICRRGCPNDWRVLVVGDRIDCGTRLRAGGARVANWVHANGIGGWGIAEAISASRVKCAPMPGMYSVARELVVEPYTKVVGPKSASTGDASPLRVGDYLFYTGSGPDPNPLTSSLWAFTVYVTQREGY